MLRDATDADADRILRWRNHPHVRAMSFTTHEITEEEHAAWWRRVQRDPDRRLLVFEREGEPAGVVTFDLDPDHRSGTWGFYLDIDRLEARGDLMPAWFALEREALDHAFDVLGLDRLHGEMLARNTVVRQLHRRHGFTEVGTEQREVEDGVEEVVRIELRAEDRR